MEEGETTQRIGMVYDYNERAAHAIADRERYIKEFIRNYQVKNNHSEVLKSK